MHFDITIGQNSKNEPDCLQKIIAGSIRFADFRQNFRKVPLSQLSVTQIQAKLAEIS